MAWQTRWIAIWTKNKTIYKCLSRRRRIKTFSTISNLFLPDFTVPPWQLGTSFSRFFTYSYQVNSHRHLNAEYPKSHTMFSITLSSTYLTTLAPSKKALLAVILTQAKPPNPTTPEHQEEKRENREFPFIFPCFQGCHKLLWFSCSRGIFPPILSFSLQIPTVWLDRSRKSSQSQEALKGFHLKVSH